jgi:hypothetical protein
MDVIFSAENPELRALVWQNLCAKIGKCGGLGIQPYGFSGEFHWRVDGLMEKGFSTQGHFIRFQF